MDRTTLSALNEALAHHQLVSRGDLQAKRLLAGDLVPAVRSHQGGDVAPVHGDLGTEDRQRTAIAQPQTDLMILGRAPPATEITAVGREPLFHGPGPGRRLDDDVRAGADPPLRRHGPVVLERILQVEIPHQLQTVLENGPQIRHHPDQTRHVATLARSGGGTGEQAAHLPG